MTKSPPNEAVLDQTVNPPPPRRHVSALSSLSNSILSTSRSRASQSQYQVSGDDGEKKSKKQKHRSKERSKRSHKKRRRDDVVPENSVSTTVNADLIQRLNAKDNHNQRPKTSDKADSSIANVVGQAQNSFYDQFYINNQDQSNRTNRHPMSYLNYNMGINQPQASSQMTRALQESTLNASHNPAVPPGVSARSAAHAVLFSAGGSSGHSTLFQSRPLLSAYHFENTADHNGLLYSTTDGRNESSVQLNKSKDDSSAVVESANSSATSTNICTQNVVTNVTTEDLRELFHLTLVDASKRLGMCTTLFKKICRRKNIIKWPYRKIRSLMRKAESLQHYLANDQGNIPESVKKSYTDQVKIILEKVDMIKIEAIGPPTNDLLVDSSVAPDEIIEREIVDITNKKKNTDDSIGVTSSADMCNASQNDSSSSCDGSEDQKRKRSKTSYDLKTGWVANCSTCGKLGKYRHPSQGRVFQHSSGTGKYCGYFRDNPRREQLAGDSAALSDRMSELRNIRDTSSVNPPVSDVNSTAGKPFPSNASSAQV
jgi:hypothetical protein